MSCGAPRAVSCELEVTMPVEAELTAIVRDPAHVRAELGKRAEPEHSVYADTYYDRPDLGMDADGYELRVRTITTGARSRVVLTYKEPPVENGQGSKPEHETTVDDADVPGTIFTGLGLVEVIAFEKHCENYRFTAQGRELLATVVRIPELDEQTFIELETAAETDDVPAALSVVRAVLAELDITDQDLSTQSYTSRVAAARLSVT
jgi:adenylate cyclase class 2